MTERTKENLKLTGILALFALGIIAYGCSGCASPIMASRNVSVYVTGGSNTLWITSEPAGGASVLSGIPTNAIEAVARGADMGATAVK